MHVLDFEERERERDVVLVRAEVRLCFTENLTRRRIAAGIRESRVPLTSIRSRFRRFRVNIVLFRPVVEVGSVYVQFSSR